MFNRVGFANALPEQGKVKQEALEQLQNTGQADAELFVRTLYKAVLQREGDPGGIVHHVHSLGTAPTLQDAAKLLGLFAASPEAHRIRSAERLPAISLGTYGDAISIGSHCITSALLKKYGAKEWSGPFDWIFSSPEIVSESIADDFSTFLDRKLHVIVPEGEKLDPTVNFCDHSYYKEKFGVKFMFNHYDISKDDVFEYYVRCVERFRNALHSGRSLLLISVTRNMRESQFQQLCESFRAWENVAVLAISARRGSADNFGAALVSKAGRNAMYELKTMDILGGTAFHSMVDERNSLAIVANFIGAREAPAA